MVFKAISIEDRALFESYLKKFPPTISDVSFTNLYLWHFSRSISYCEINDFLCIKTTYPNQDPFIFMPIGSGDIKDTLEQLWHIFKQNQQPFSIHSLDEQQKQQLEHIMPGQFEYLYNRDRSDYIYKTQELIELKGRKFHKKKNHVNHFYDSYPNYTYESLNTGNKDELLSVWNQWFAQNPNPTEGLKNEHIGICKALENFEMLPFKGGILKVDQQIVAFTLGEELNPNTAVIHIEKADTAYHGAFQVINQLFLKHEWAAYTFVNREEDLGVEGLRKAKMSYQPCHLIDKYTALLIAH